jgi:uncharacterized protein YukE
MAQAHVDPTELRRFAQDLNRFSGELQSLMAGLHTRMLGLEKTWRDQEQRKFAEEFDQTMKVLNRFLKLSEHHVSFLMKKAGYIEDYLQQH